MLPTRIEVRATWSGAASVMGGRGRFESPCGCAPLRLLDVIVHLGAPCPHSRKAPAAAGAARAATALIVVAAGAARAAAWAQHRHTLRMPSTTRSVRSRDENSLRLRAVPRLRLLTATGRTAALHASAPRGGHYRCACAREKSERMLPRSATAAWGWANKRLARSAWGIATTCLSRCPTSICCPSWPPAAGRARSRRRGIGGRLGCRLQLCATAMRTASRAHCAEAEDGGLPLKKVQHDCASETQQLD